MIPNITLGNKTISAYMIMALIGVFAAGIFSISRFKKEDDKMELLVALLWSGVGLMVGGHLLYAITNMTGIINSIRNGDGFMTLLMYFSGNVFYGGLIGSYAAFLLYFRIKKKDICRYIDEGALFIPLFHVFGRIGCFLSGCCYGAECEVGFIYKYSIIEAANGVRRFPVQLVEAAGNLLIFLLLYYLYKRGTLRYRLIYLYFMIYPILRFVLEFFRGDSYRGFLFSLSTSQIISIFVFIYGAVMLAVTCIKHKNTQTE